ncbi:SigE family RNA polymerase sigma factor [Ornithinimicrobium tianjinense]|uniref:DNA-directed RNA polymerase sigma-70 factor n=1 Tax=Ornithinimicrobium tianjinense TaxID=1195761 RepID=A0A917F901_9MICO|nr:SigE family RNA polymerase sigma factor [Ornithinimicrobium tianjinense]GGF56637.1 DNA-directed RNA polymerase sigma-70 factor [Ornithinimicrobium tianjinense]
MRLFGGSGRQAEAEAYVEAAMPRLVGLAFALTGHKADAEDLVQDTLALVVTKWSRVREAENIDAYVRRTMINTLASRKRRRSSTELVSHETVTADWSAPPSPAADQDSVDRATVLAMVRALPDRQRAVVALRYYEDLADREIAHALGCSEQAVRSAAHAALRSLRSLVPTHLGEEAQR